MCLVEVCTMYRSSIRGCYRFRIFKERKGEDFRASDAAIRRRCYTTNNSKDVVMQRPVRHTMWQGGNCTRRNANISCSLFCKCYLAENCANPLTMRRDTAEKDGGEEDQEEE